MEIGRINNNSQAFGAKFSPEFEAYARAVGEKVYRHHSKTDQKQFDHDIKMLKQYVPDGTITIEKEIEMKNQLVHQYDYDDDGCKITNPYSISWDERNITHSILNVPQTIYKFVLKQKGKMDITVDNPVYDYKSRYVKTTDFYILKSILREIDQENRRSAKDPKEKAIQKHLDEIL